MVETKSNHFSGGVYVGKIPRLSRLGRRSPVRKLVRGKQSKRRLWRMKRDRFEEVARLAALIGAGNRNATTVYI